MGGLMKKYISACLLILVVISSPLIADDFANEDLESASNQFSGSSIASQNQGIFQDQNINRFDQNSGAHTIYHPGYKSESTATFLAILPGFFVHGLGHFYAADYLTASILLTTELLVVSGTLGAIVDQIDNNEPGGEFDLNRASVIVSLAFFLASWIYDFAHADAAVRKYNDKIRAEIYLSSDKYNDVKVSLAVRF
jgi:hypothetical protein